MAQGLAQPSARKPKALSLSSLSLYCLIFVTAGLVCAYRKLHSDVSAQGNFVTFWLSGCLGFSFIILNVDDFKGIRAR